MKDDVATQPIADLPLFPDALEDSEESAEETRARPVGQHVGQPGRQPAPRGRGPAAPDMELSLEETDESPVADERQVAQVELPIEPIPSRGTRRVSPGGADDSRPRVAPLPERLKSALLDAAAMLGVLAVLLAGGALMGAPSGLSALAYYLPTWVLFSFLYHVVPLVFWGRTPGMVLAGLTARTADDEPMTGAQAVRRWLAGQATLLLLGLPELVTLTDRFSGTVTRISR